MCPRCGKAASSLKYDDRDDAFVCRHCYAGESAESCRLFEFGHENTSDPKGSTAHVRDIKNRRYDFKEKRTYYAEAPKTYFFSKG